MKIRPFYLLTFFTLDEPFYGSESLTICDVFDELNLTPLNEDQSKLVRVGISKDGDVAFVRKAESKSHIGGMPVMHEDDIVSFIASMTYNKRLIIINTAKRDEYSSKLITTNTFAHNFRVRSDFYPIPLDIAESKLINFNGIGAGTATINIETQEVENVNLLELKPKVTNKYGVIMEADDETITVSCCFANGGVNTLCMVQ